MLALNVAYSKEQLLNRFITKLVDKSIGLSTVLLSIIKYIDGFNTFTVKLISG